MHGVHGDSTVGRAHRARGRLWHVGRTHIATDHGVVGFSGWLAIKAEATQALPHDHPSSGQILGLGGNDDDRPAGAVRFQAGSAMTHGRDGGPLGIHFSKEIIVLTVEFDEFPEGTIAFLPHPPECLPLRLEISPSLSQEPGKLPLRRGD